MREPKQQPLYIYSPAEAEIVTGEIRARRGFFVRLAYVDAADDLVAGILLGQIIYWFLPSEETGLLKTEIYRAGFRWIAKERKDWKAEIRITPKQYDRAIGVLEARGLVITTVWKWKGLTTVHVMPWWEAIVARMNDDDTAVKLAEESRQRVIRELTKGQFGDAPLGDSGIDERSIHTDKDSETTPEISSESSIGRGNGVASGDQPQGEIQNMQKSVKEEIEEHARTFVKLRKQKTPQQVVQSLFERSVNKDLQERVIKRVEEIEAEEEEN
jgi:hypothetical protein